MHTDCARFAPNCTLSRHLLTVIVVVVLCYTHLHVCFGIKSYAPLALVNRIGMLLPLRNSGGSLTLSFLVGQKERKSTFFVVVVGQKEGDFLFCV